MAEAVKLPVKNESKSTQPTSAFQAWRPFESLHQEIDRLFDDFNGGLLGLPFRRSMFAAEPFVQREAWAAVPAVNIAETEKAFEITAELPGLDEKNVEVKLANGNLTIKGEKQEEKEEKKKDYYLHERSFGFFERSFQVPEGIDQEKVEATFKKGVLTVTLPKTVEAQKAEKKIAVKAA